VIDKNWQEIAPDPDWVRQEVARLDEAVDEFADAMKAKLSQKAHEGWTGWDKPESGIKIWNAMLAQGAAVTLARGQEVDIAYCQSGDDAMADQWEGGMNPLAILGPMFLAVLASLIDTPAFFRMA